MTLAQCMSTYQLTFRLGYETTDSSSPDPMADLLAACARQQQRAAIRDLPDALNPYCLDTEKVRAFLTYFPQLPAADLEALRARTLALEDEDLYLVHASPVTAAQIAAGYRLSVLHTLPDSLVVLAMQIEPDTARVRRLADEARAATTAAHAEVLASEAAQAALAPEAQDALRALLDARSHMQIRRSAAAYAWLRHARLLGDPAMLEAAETAFAAYYLRPATGGMPGQ